MHRFFISYILHRPIMVLFDLCHVEKDGFALLHRFHGVLGQKANQPAAHPW